MRISLVGGDSEQLDLVPSKIIGIGDSDRAHAIEMGEGLPEGLPEEPLMFLEPMGHVCASDALARP
jgi:2-keto-4-pentenoate hydratase/2-oxohepta-3-ene-1,7-dioic acid hydratase in catechol pathway